MTARILCIASLLTLAAPATLAGQATASQGTAGARASSADRTRQILEAYWKDHDARYVAENAVFTMMPSGEVIRGREAIAKHIDGFYHGALDAKAEIVNAVFGENKGVLEALVVGRHTGTFAGVAATGRDVRVPISVVYDLENGLITKARIYLMINVLLEQIRGTPSA